MAGFIKLDRDLIDHPAFRSRDRDYFSAFLWLVQEAALAPRSIGYGQRTIQIQRGQLSHSIRHIANTWGWPRMRVHRFIKKLSLEGLVLVENVTPACYDSGTVYGTAETVITICKYDEFSGSSETLGQPMIRVCDATRTSNKNLRTEEKKKRRLPRRESQRQPDLLGGEVITMPPDEIAQAFEAYQIVARDLNLSVPRSLSDGKPARRPAIRRILKDQSGILGWIAALDRLRKAKWITSGGWSNFSIDDFANPDKFRRLNDGEFDVVFGEPEETPWERDVREYKESGGEHSLYRQPAVKGEDGT